jgi:hypothetical protein
MNDTLLVQLVPRGTNVVEEISPVGDFKQVIVDDNWEVIRDRVFRACCIGGRRSVIFINGHVELYEKRHQADKATWISTNGQHGLWLYMGRLLQRFGHVYVPPLIRTDYPEHEYYNAPANGMVVGYQIAALQSLPNLDGPLGRQLCRNGYDSFTVGDYFYYPMGEEVFKEVGTHASWQAAYLRYFDSI